MKHLSLPVGHASRSTDRVVLIISFLLVVLYGLFLRFHNLSVIPAAISHDELDHAVNGIAIRHTGRDAQDQHYVWELYPTETQTYTAELSALWHALVPHFSANQTAIARTPNAIFGLVTVVAFSVLVFQFFRSKALALISGLLLLFNPWHIYVSRTGYEAPLALSWLVLSMVFFWKTVSPGKVTVKTWWLFGTLLAMSASFFSYHGYKFIYPFVYSVLFIVCVPLKQYLDRKRFSQIIRHTIPLLIVSGWWLLLFSFFLVRLSQGAYGERSGEVFFLNRDVLAQEVNAQRRDSLESHLKSVFINKLSVIADHSLTNLTAAFSPGVLFTNGFDGSVVIGLWEHGFLYLFQAPLILLGAHWLILKDRKLAVGISALIIISLLPVLLHTSTSITLRSNLFLLLLNFLAALGVYAILSCQHFLVKYLVILLIPVAFISIARFHYFYFVRFPIQTVDNAMFQKRLLTGYVTQHQRSHKPLTIVTHDPFNTVRHLLYQGGYFTPQETRQWQSFMSQKSREVYSFNNLTVTTSCQKALVSDSSDVVLVEPTFLNECDLDTRYATQAAQLVMAKEQMYKNVLASPKDSGAYYYVYNDQVCRGEPLPAFIDIKKPGLFAVETLAREVFCQTWVRTETVNP